jgi:MFS family permease
MCEHATGAGVCDACHRKNSIHRSLANGTLVSCLSIFFLISGLSLTFPQMQSRRDELGCDALCYGSMTSVRGALAFVGTAVIGRLSDRNDSLLARSFGSIGKGGGSNGRRGCLFLGIIASLSGCIIAVTLNSLSGLWLSMIPSAFLQHNFDVFKALLSEYHNDIDNNKDNSDNDAERKFEETSSTSSRSCSVGKLGMTVGISFMIGPMVAASTNPSFQSATKIATFSILLSGATILLLPLPLASTKQLIEKSDIRKKTLASNEFTLSKMIKLQTPKSRAAMMLLFIRLNMALAFHIFNTIWPDSLKARFQFGPSDHARFMSFIGVTYAVSQGFFAKRMINVLGAGGKSYGMMLCCAVLGIGRYIAFHTDSLVIMYASFLFIINALGILNTVITADSGSIAPSNEIGSLFGLLQASESAGGMIGPVMGGVISHYFGKDAPLMAVIAIYTCLFFFLSWGYNGLVLSVSHDERKKMKKIK